MAGGEPRERGEKGKGNKDRLMEEHVITISDNEGERGEGELFKLWQSLWISLAEDALLTNGWECLRRTLSEERH